MSQESRRSSVEIPESQNEEIISEVIPEETKRRLELHPEQGSPSISPFEIPEQGSDASNFLEKRDQPGISTRQKIDTINKLLSGRVVPTGSSYKDAVELLDRETLDDAA